MIIFLGYQSSQSLKSVKWKVHLDILKIRTISIFPKYSNTSGEYSIFYNPLKIRRGGRGGQQSFVNVSSGKMEDENRSREGLVRSFTRYSILLSISIFHFHPSTPSIHSPASKREALRINLSLRRAEKRERKLINPYAFHFHEGEKGVACFLRDFHASNPRFP